MRISKTSSHYYWLEFFKKYYKALLGLVALCAGFYVMYSFSAEDKLYSRMYIIVYIILAIYFVVLSLKEIFMHKLEIERLKSILEKHEIDAENEKAIISEEK